MRSRFAVALFPMLSTALFTPSSAASATGSGTRSFEIPLTGEAELASGKSPLLAGDMDGSGILRLSIDPASRQICYDFSVTQLATPLMAHIHKGPETDRGPSVVTLFTGPGAELNGCRMWTEKWLSEIVANPSAFYVNLYTTEYPDGALRGQLAS